MNDNNMERTWNCRSLSSTKSASRLQTEHPSICEPVSSYYLRAMTVDGLHIQEPKNMCRCQTLAGP